MKNVKRKAAVCGFSVLSALLIFMLTDIKAAFLLIPSAVICCAFLTVKRSVYAWHLLIISLSFTAAFLSFSFTNAHFYQPTLSLEGHNRAVTGEVCEYPSETAGSSVMLKNCVVGGNKVRSRIKLYYPAEYDFVPGDKISCTAYSLFVTSSDNDKYYYHSISDNCWLTATVYSDINITHSEKSSLYNKVLRLKKYVSDKLLSSSFPGENTGVMTALLTGDRAAVSNRTGSDFRLSGVSHIFAVSGMHLSIWTGILFLILQKRARAKITGNIAVILFVIAYCIFTGLSPSVLRAGIMLITVYLAAIFRKRADGINSLGLSAIIILIPSPFLAGNISFLLSFFATLAIVTLVPVFTPAADNKTENPVIKNSRKIFQAFTVSLLVIFILIPLTSFFFGYISLFSPLTSLICTPLAEAVMLFASAALFFPSGSIIFNILLSSANTLTSFMLRITSFFGRLPFGIISSENNYVIIWFYLTVIILTAVYYLSRKSKEAITITALIACCAILVTGLITNIGSGDDIEIFIPVSSDSVSVAITADNGGKTAILGCSGNSSSYYEIKEFLYSHSVSVIDRFFIPCRRNAENNILPLFTDDFICKDFIFPGTTDTDHRSEKYIYSDNVKVKITDDAELSYNAYKSGWTGLLNIKGKKIVISVNDTKNSNISYKIPDGDILIYSGTLPANTDKSAFDDIYFIDNNKNNSHNNIEISEKNINLKF